MKSFPGSRLSVMIQNSWPVFRMAWGGWLVAGGMAMLAGCAGEPPAGAGAGLAAGASFGPGYPAGSAVWSEAARGAYRTAFSAGLQDQQEGYRFDDDRGAWLLDQDVRGFYRQGYRRGYYHEAAVRRTARQGEATAAEGPGGDEKQH